MARDPVAAGPTGDPVNEDLLGLRILGGSSGLAAALCTGLLLAYWPHRPPEEDPVEQVRRLRLGPSGPGRAIPSLTLPSGPDRLIHGDLFAMRTYARVVPADLQASGFHWLPAPEPGSWRSGAGRHESHQDFLAFTQEQREAEEPNRRVLVLRSVGHWPRSRRGLIPDLTRFLMIFFQRPVRWEEPLRLPSEYRLSRDGASEHLQYPTAPILSQLRRELPPDALAVVGITAADLYPAPSWQFVFGLADLKERVAVISHHRLHPDFWGEAVTPQNEARVSLRLFRVLAHEIAHTLGLAHCVAFRCVMNGCNSLEEQDEAPLHLCPVCLAKLAWRLRWRVEARYGGLAHLLYHLDHPAESRFFRRQFGRMQPPPPLPELHLAPARSTPTPQAPPGG